MTEGPQSRGAGGALEDKAGWQRPGDGRARKGATAGGGWRVLLPSVDPGDGTRKGEYGGTIRLR